MALRRILAVALPLLSLSVSGLAQTLPDGRFAVTVKESGNLSPPRYTIVPESGGSSSYFDCSNLARVSGWESSHPDDMRPSTVELAFKVVEDAVLVTATAYFGDKYDVNETPDTLARLPRKSIGTYTARVNESVELAGMTEVGLQPVTVQVVTARDPDGAHPMFISEAPSVQIELTGQNRDFFTLALHNISARAVTEYAICALYANKGGASCRGTKGTATHPIIIAAGSTLTIPYAISHSGRDTPNGYVPDPDPSIVVLKRLVFTDGGVEGMDVSPLTPEGMRLLTH